MFVANPPMDCRGVQTIFLAELGSEIPFFRRYENGVADDKGWQEQHERPGEIEGQSSSYQSANAAQVEGVS